MEKAGSDNGFIITALRRQRQGDPQVLDTQLNLTSEFQASEGPFPKKKKVMLGMVANPFNHSVWEAEAGRSF